ncbi:MAG TPA: DUF5668 domain-containing protein [Pseudonocardiaceae bacterium]
MRTVKLVSGVVLLGVGLGALVDQLRPETEVWETVRQWWPAVIILIGLVAALRAITQITVLLGPLIVIAIGLPLLLVVNDNLRQRLPLGWWPLMLMVPGALLLAGLARRQDVPHGGYARRKSLVVSSGSPVWPVGEFALAHLTTVASGEVIDLRKAKPADNAARLDVTAVAGGVEIRVPKGWGVTVDQQVVLGKSRAVPIVGEAQQPVLHLKALVILAGLSVTQVEGTLSGAAP